MRGSPIKILTLRQNVSLAEAQNALQSRGFGGFLSSALHGPLRSLAQVFVPFRLYKVEASDASRSQTFFIAVDSVAATLDSYAFEAVPPGSDIVSIETCNAMAPALDESLTRESVQARVRRHMYSTGFFRLRAPSFSASWLAPEFHVPYWVGFYGRGAKAHMVVMDAIRRRREGAKTRELFSHWLLETPAIR